MGEFVVDTKGHCFLCLYQINSHSAPVKLEPGESAEPNLSSSPVYSIQNLLHYLKMDIGQVAIDEGKIIPPKLLSQLEGLRLKVELCEDCVSLNATFFELCQQLKKIKADVASHLNLIHDKLLDAEAEKAEQFRKLAKRQIDDGRGDLMTFGVLELAEALRNQAFKKCSQKLHINPVRTQSQVPEPIPSSSECSMNETETEEPQDIIVKLDPDLINSTSEHGFDDDWDDCDPPSDISRHMPSSSKECDTELRIVKTENNEQEAATEGEEMQHSATSSNDVGVPMLFENINPETGEFQCISCPKKFPCIQELQQHYQSYHLNIHNCLLCGKECRTRSQYKKHHQRVHLGIKYLCSICNQTFSRQDSLKTHMQVDHFGQTFDCPRCFKAFTHPQAKSRHMRLVNCGVKTSLARNANSTHLIPTPSTSLLPSPTKPQPKSCYPCDLCSKIFPTNAARSEHKRVYHNGLRHVCDYCQAEFMHRSSKSTHKRTCAKRPQHGTAVEDPLMDLI